MRLGQVYDLTNRRTLAMEAYRKAIAFAPQAEAAKESRRYLSAPYRAALPLFLLIAVILFRPQGLLGRAEERTL